MKHTIIGVVVFVFFVWVWYNSSANRKGFFTEVSELLPTVQRLPPKKDKPICSQIVVPAGDCIPQHLANLPPDPGPAGALTIDGVITNKEGVRDDVYRRIVERWGHSERAVQALFLIAKRSQQKVHYGDDLTKEQAIRIMQDTSPVIYCYGFSVPEDIQQDQAMQRVEGMVVNTPARFERWRKFDSLLHMGLFRAYEGTLQEACGYNPEALNN